MEQPLIDKEKVITETGCDRGIKCQYHYQRGNCEYLNPIYDLERLITQVTYMSANQGIWLPLKFHRMLPPIKTLLQDFSCAQLKRDTGGHGFLF